MLPKVSICMITYNHEKYIAQAIESIVMQEATFKYELVIGEDCSTDKTREIVLSYKEKYPDKIKLLFPDVNQGMMNNFIQTLKSCTGEYVALCEGDDYWIDPVKLQKQVNFLEQHPDYSIAFHKVKIIDEVTGVEGYSNLNQKPVSTIEDLFIENFIFTASCMFKNGLIKEFPDLFYKTGTGDWLLHILNAQAGKIRYMDEVMGAYRIHEGGTIYNIISFSEKLKAAYFRDLYTFQSLDEYLNFKYHKYIKKLLSRVYKQMSILHIEENNRAEAIKYINKSLETNFRFSKAALFIPIAYSPNPKSTINFVKRLKKAFLIK